ncbi:hypothetical protein AVEN_39712-1 [Araneus ventricosus]|uniref:Uncharacterized protein n=1 Tax=Araneus ventricosus TaxID=182803 RepID=A0A4Y2LZD3_ARAVE|nr:hypothetical protein AVEN_39712-1 [Araneus ventricosus]
MLVITEGILSRLNGLNFLQLKDRGGVGLSVCISQNRRICKLRENTLLFQAEIAAIGYAFPHCHRFHRPGGQLPTDGTSGPEHLRHRYS